MMGFDGVGCLVCLGDGVVGRPLGSHLRVRLFVGVVVGDLALYNRIVER